MPNQQSKIICIGEVLWDCLPTCKKPGGAPMNVALHLQKFGLDVSMVSAIGNDKLGDELLEFIIKSGLKTDFIQIDEKLPTSEVKVHIADSHKVSYEICEPVAWDNIRLTSGLIQNLGKMDIVVYGTLAARNKETALTIHHLIQNIGFKVIDVNLRPPFVNPEIVIPLIEKADLVKLNEDEIIQIAQWHSNFSTDYEELIDWISKKFKCRIICLTLGDKGAYLYIDKHLYKHGGYKVEAIDTVGSGDAFLAGAIYSLLNSFSPSKILDVACAAGAFVATKTGASPNYSPDDIFNMIK
jgi:fructokinase